MLLLPRGSRLLTCFACLALFASGPVQAQLAEVATVSFSCNFPGSNPPHYGFSVSATRQASYTSDGKLNAAKDSAPDPDSDAPSSDDGPFRMDFTLSPATSAHIFALAKAAHYFEGNIDSKKKNIASTGEKTLSYGEAGKTNIASYNYSLIPAVQELTTLFQNLSSAVEFGRRLDYEYRYQKLALDEEMKRMEDTTTLQDVGPDLPATAPVLKKIADDPTVINSVRARAMRLLQHAGASGK